MSFSKPSGALAPIFCLTLMLLGDGCSAVENPDHAACRRDWVKALNVIFETSFSNTDIRWIHACMAKKGYKRIYDNKRCAKLEASIREPRCYAKIEEDLKEG